MNLTSEGDDSLLRLLLITSHTKLGLHVIQLSQWHDVFTLLHPELRDYSLGQIAFAVFQVLFAIT